ncbi:MAG: hypothetical protein IIY44_01710 [Erysipelotrichales bacterium]|nr:hypothetical protein [Erysipelotrichales bacterium]
MKKFLAAVLAMFILLTGTITDIHADDNMCYPYENIDPEDIVNVEIIDDEIYIDVLMPNDIYFPTGVGKCPSPTKTTYSYASKQKLVEMKNKINNGTAATSTIIGFLIGLANPYAGAVAGYILSRPGMLVTAIDDALTYRNKENYTIRTTYTCEDSYQGNRGWVYRYKVDSIYIY